MKKLHLFKTVLLLCALIVGSGSAWAEDSETITFAEIYGSPSNHVNVNGVEFNKEHGGLDYCTITFNKASGSSNPQYNKKDHWIQQYKGNTFIISSTKYIKSISCALGSTTYTGENISSSENAYSCAITTNTLNITNSTTYTQGFTITNDEAGQIKIKSMTITYADPVVNASDVVCDADATSGVITYTISYPNGSTMTAVEKTPGYDWIDNVTVVSAENKVEFTMAKNEGTARDGYITLTYGTITKDVKVTQSAPVTKYAVTFSNPDHGTLTVKRGETTLSSGDKVPSGATLTIEVSADDRYKLNGSGWQYKVGEGSWTDGVGTTYDVTSAVSIQANIIAREYKTITWSANGVETEQEVEVGESIDFSRTASAPTGFKFMGWTASTIDGTRATAPTYVTEATCSADATYYAVFAKQTNSEEEITKSFGFETESDANWTIDGPTRVNSNAYTGSYSGKINTNHTYVTFNDKVNVTNFSFAFTRASNNNNYEVTIETSSDNSIWTAAATYAMSTFDDDGTYQVKSKDFDGNTELFVRFHCRNTTAIRYVDDVTIKYNGIVTTNEYFCTTIVESVTMNGAGYATFASPNPLNLTSLPTGLTAYKAKVSGANVTFSPIEQEISANTGILLGGDEDETYYIPVAASGTSVDGNEFQVNTSGSTFSETSGKLYFALKKSADVLQFGTFDPASLAIPANKAYLIVDESAFETPARELSISFEDGETTGVADVRSKMDGVRGEYFDLQGRKVAQPTKGLYIVNGKKVVIK